MDVPPFRQEVEIKVARHLADIHERFRDRTMIPREIFIENLQIIEHVSRHSDGAFVECGTWKGGMSAAMLTLGGNGRDYYFYDSFEGLPEAKDIDGISAKNYQNNTLSPGYHDNCSADLETFMNTISRTGHGPERVHVHKGWFENTVPQYRGGDISLLRLDGDWYDSTMQCLTHLFPYVRKGGYVIIDDYQYWEGCLRAVHDFLSGMKSISPIERTAVSHVAYIIKKD